MSDASDEFLAEEDWANPATRLIAEWITETPALAEHWSAMYLTTLRYGAAQATTDGLLAAQLEQAFLGRKEYGAEVAKRSTDARWMQVARYIRIWDAM